MQTIPDAIAALEDGRTTARALVEDCLACIADPAGEGARAFVAVYANQARAGADAMDTLPTQKHPSGPTLPSLSRLIGSAAESVRKGTQSTSSMPRGLRNP